MVGPWKMVYPIVDFRVRIARPFCSEFEDGPLVTVLVIEKLDELISRIAICFLRPDGAGTRGHNN